MGYRIVRAPGLVGWEDHFYSINREWLEEHFTVTPADEDQLRHPERIIAGGGAVLFILEDDRPVGTGALIREANGDMELAKMGVLRTSRGKGAGTLLIAALLEEAKSRTDGIIYLETLEVLAAAVALYKKSGFVRTGEPHAHPLFGRTTFRMELRDSSGL